MIDPSQWAAFNPERRRVSDLRPDPKNSRTHSVEQRSAVRAAMQKWGWTMPVLVDEADNILAGHLRTEVAKDLGIDVVPVIIARGWSDEQKRAYIIADNQLAIGGAGWDKSILKDELAALLEVNFDISLLNFSDKELADLLAPAAVETEGEGDPDEAGDPPQVPATEPGDVWILGRHRLVCGDCTDADTVAKALNGVTPHLMVTDPPYGVKYEPGLRDRADKALGRRTNTKRATGQVQNDDRADWREAWALFPGQVAYVWHGMKAAGTVFASLEACEFEVRAEIVWVKQRPAIGWGRYAAQHESCFYAVRGTLPKFKGGCESTVWSIEHVKNDTGHGTQKPVEAMKRPIEHNSSPGQAIYEPFSGSGTTILAAEMTGRACHAIELDAGYVDVAVTRWERFTGRQAILEETGETFLQVLARRRPDAKLTAKRDGE